MFAVFDNCISSKECARYVKIIEGWYNHCISLKQPSMEWSSRILNITNDPICGIVKPFLEKRLNLTIETQNVELQCWPVDSFSLLHRHDAEGREIYDYNSLLYLNDDFAGGEFFTENGIVIKPIPGRLTFFNGNQISHGLNRVFYRNRYTIIFWWKNTQLK